MPLQELRDDAAPLIRVTFRRPIWLENFDRWVPYDLDVRAAVGNASAPWHLAGRRLDRCFCRYVTEPLFLTNLSARAAARLRQLEARPPRVVLHLRTMVNHLEKKDLHYLHCFNRTSWLPWFRAACDSTAFREHSAYVMADRCGATRTAGARLSAECGGD